MRDYDAKQGKYITWLTFLTENGTLSDEAIRAEFHSRYGYYPAGVIRLNETCWRAGPVINGHHEE